MQHISVPQRNKREVLFGPSREQSLLTAVIPEDIIGWPVIPVGCRGQTGLRQHWESKGIVQGEDRAVGEQKHRHKR